MEDAEATEAAPAPEATERLPRGEKYKVGETRLYERMMGAVKPAHHDIPMFLHCLVEQVAQTQEGSAQEDSKNTALSSMQGFLAESSSSVVAGGKCEVPKGCERYAASTPKPSSAGAPGDATADEDAAKPEQGLSSLPDWWGSGPRLSFLDQLRCSHELCGDAPQEDSTLALQSVLGAVEDFTCAPGVRRSCLPENATHSSAQRLEMQSRIYPFAPGVQPSDMEQLVLVHAFESLLRSVQPEREPSAFMRERTVRERVPADLLIQTLHGALRTEPFVASAYLPRYDCLLLALYHRSPFGRMLWHSWEQDVPLWEEDKEPPPPPEEEKPPEPDPAQEAADKKKGGAKGKKEEEAPKGKKDAKGKGKVEEAPPPPQEEEVKPPGPEIILHEVLRTSMIEKLVTPPDGSIILVSRYQRDKAVVEEIVEPVPDPNDPLAAGADEQAAEGQTTAPAATAAAPPAQATAPPPAAQEDATAAGEGTAEEGAVDEAAGLEQAQQPAEELLPLGGWCVARVFKESLTFGIAEDEVWRKLREGERDRQEAIRAAEVKAREEAAAAAAAAEAAKLAEQQANAKDAKKGGDKGKKDDKKKDEAPPPTEPEEAAEPEPPIPLPFADTSFGQLWVAFEDAARFTVRLQGERVFAAGLAAVTAAEEQPPLPPLGAVVTYTQPSGDTLQVLSDGTVEMCRASAPRWYPGGTDHALPPAAFDRVVQSEAAAFLPGCDADTEVSRQISPLGTVIRRLLSGRSEVYYSDGTSAWRNPTEAELNVRLDSAKAGLAGTDKSWLDVIERLRSAYLGRGDGAISAPPTAEEKAFGLPGHWMVVQRDGSVTGRVRRLEVETPAPDAEQAAVATEGGMEAASEEAAVTPAKPSQEELLDGFATEDGMIEYSVKPIAVATQVELRSKQRTLTNAMGLAIFEGPDDGSSNQEVGIHRDGTRVTRAKGSGSELTVSVAKEGMDHVVCQLSEGGMRVLVSCNDGTQVQVIPQKASGSGLQPIRPWTDDFIADSLHAAVTVERKDRSVFKSGGLGDVSITTASKVGGSVGYTSAAYVASCRQGELKLEADGSSFAVKADQSVQVSSPDVPGEADSTRSPRCTEPGKPVCWPTKSVSAPQDGEQGEQQPEEPPELPELPQNVAQARLFVVYGDGNAEEFHTAAAVEDVLRTAREDPEAVVVSSEPMDSPLKEVCCHTVFKNRTRAGLAPAKAAAAAADLSIGKLVQDSSLGMSVPLMPPLPAAPAAGITAYRQFLQFPAITEEMQTKFLGTLKQYREWEQKFLTASRAVAAVVEVKKDKKKKSDDKPGKKKGKKDKGPTEEELLREAMLKAEQEPKFAPKLNLSVFEHKVQTFGFRAIQRPEPSNDELLERGQQAAENPGGTAPAQKDAEAEANAAAEMGETEPLAEGAEQGGLETEGAAELAGADSSSAAAEAPSGEPQTTAPLPEQFEPESQEEQETTADAAGERPRETQSEAVPETAEAAPASKPTAESASGQGPPRKKKGEKTVLQTPTFSYFKSELGLKFLDDTGTADRPPIQKSKQKQTQPVTNVQRRNPWNPRLVGEAEPEEEEPPADERQSPYGQETLPPPVDEEQPAPEGAPGGGEQWQGQDGEGQEEEPEDYFGDTTDTALRAEDMQRQDTAASGYPQPRGSLPITPVRHETPGGPHPDKRGSQWNIKGELRQQKAAVAQAYTGVNTAYLEVEGATDRRVRTSSVAHKKNAAKAPSVQLVRKQGMHTVGRGPEMAAHQILEQQVGTENAEDMWRLSSTLQGLGDANNLVEVKPGTCRFGPLRAGSVYRMAIYFRNLDVDVTRFSVAPVSHPMVSVLYSPGHLAPGIATKLVVELRAVAPERVEQLLDIRVKAHIVKVPVTARVLDADEYDRLDAESMNLHGRRIGRHREKADGTGAGPVEVVRDEAYCRAVLAESYIPLPPDFDDAAPLS